ncbi:response regulator transcription factor [Rothia sp. P100]|uniref:response regulator n=1 Tax=unclassified Rothia (in: high G+C Gram-positive bacteria) TaxID=2689056 RepID=UPI00203F9EB0|nr:response regulator transcription factor [Rothia sp. P100]MCM3509893.1 response regulator transcription factor [Rothia sp. P100]
MTIRVLLVDDHPVVRAGLRAMFEEFENITVVAEAADGGAALSEVARFAEQGHPLDAVVMDLQMKPVDGIIATRSITEQFRTPVLVLTTFDTQTNIVAAVEAGALGYLLKDAPPEQVQAAVVATAEGRRTLSPDIAATLMDRMHRPVITLSQRETEILTLLATGATNREMAQRLFISESTVKTHLVHIYSKLGVDNRTAAVATARAENLL